MAKSLDQYYCETNISLNIYTNMSTNPENLVKNGLLVSEISLLQAIVKKEERRLQKHYISLPAEAWWANKWSLALSYCSSVPTASALAMA